MCAEPLHALDGLCAHLRSPSLARRGCRLPLASRPHDGYRAPGYPIVQILFVLVAAAVVASTIGAAPAESAKGALLLALGVPVYYWFAARR